MSVKFFGLNFFMRSASIVSSLDWVRATVKTVNCFRSYALTQPTFATRCSPIAESGALRSSSSSSSFWSFSIFFCSFVFFLCLLAWLQNVHRDVLFDPGLQLLDGLPYIPATAPALKVEDNVRFIMDREGILEARWKSRLGNKTNSRAASWISRLCGLNDELFKRLCSWPVITNPW